MKKLLPMPIRPEQHEHTPKITCTEHALLESIKRLNRANKKHDVAVAELREATAKYREIIIGMIPPVPKV
jgi:hypothetical protein